jgi:hypothetical protein
MEDERLKSQLREANDSIRKGPDGWSNFARKDGRYAYETGPDLIGWPEESLRPTKAEYATHAEFLKQPHVGLVRLLPPSLKVVSVDQLGKEKPAGPKVPGGGAYYSFTKLNHVPGYWADLKLSEGNLEVAFGPDVVGAITILGDVPLDSLTSDSPGVSTLATYARPLMSDRAKRDNERFKSGVTLAGYSLLTQAPVHENTTYALRSIAYGRSDLLVTVRVVKKNDDGSVLLLWKRIDKLSKPKLKEAPKE